MRLSALGLGGISLAFAAASSSSSGTHPSPALSASASASASASSGRKVDVLTLTTAASVAPRGDPKAPIKTIGTCSDMQRAAGGSMRFGLAHFNDLQARYSDRIGGKTRYAYLAGLLRQLKAAQPTLVVDAGDDYEKGAVAELRSNGETTRQMVQALPIDVRTIGNHDFAYGEQVVLRDLRLSAHPVLAANIKHTGLPATKQPFRPYARFDVGCVKVGVIGLVTQNFGADDQPSSAPFDGVFAQDEHYQAILERESKAHRAEVDVLIALTHLGYADDNALAHRGGRFVDIIVGAHTEDLFKEPQAVIHPDNTRTWVLQAGHYGEQIGKTDVVVLTGEKVRKVNLLNYKIVEIDEKVPVAEDVAALAKKLEDAIAPDAHGTIGRLKDPVKSGRGVAELVYRATASAYNADALIIGRDLFWGGLPRGEISLQKLYDPVLVQKQPTGTTGFSSLWVNELSGADMTLLAKTFRPGAMYEWLGQKEKFDKEKRYRLVIDKRAATYPKTLFGPESKLLKPTYAGEIIDALEAHARLRTAKGQTID